MTHLTQPQRDQLHGAILWLMVNHILAAVADMELERGGSPRISNRLRERIRELSKPVASELLDVKRAFPPLSESLLATLDPRSLEAEIDDVVGELDSLLESILRERRDLQQP